MADKIKVLIINTVATERNGITNVIFGLLRAMDKSDMQIDLVAINSPDEQYVNEIENAGGKVYVLERRIKRAFIYRQELTELIRNNGYDIVHAHGNSHTLYLEMSAAKKAGCPIRIAHAHSTRCSFGLLHKALSTPFFKSITGKIACGKAAGEFLFADKGFTIINNGIKTSKFAFNTDYRNEIRTEFGLENKKIIGHIGAFTENKNQSFLVDVLKILLEKDNSYRLMLLGDGELFETVFQEAKNYGIESCVIMVGTVSDVEKYLSAFDVFAMPSLFEGVPLSLIEAQASGLFCLASKGVPKEVNVTGNMEFLEIGKNSIRWAQKLEELPLVDNDKRKELSDIAIQNILISKFDISESAKELKSLYLSSLKETNH